MKKRLLPVAIAGMTLMAVPAFAEQHRGGRGYEHGRGYEGGHAVVVAPRGVYVAPRYGYARPYYARPYYAFRPRFIIGFGLWAGYPVSYPAYYAPYPYGYPAPYPYSYPAPPPYGSNGYPQGYPQSYPSQPYPQSSYPSYGDPTGGAVQVQPGSGASYAASGGVSFEISPSDASILVDGRYVGTVDQFGPQSAPLSLTPGTHRIEIRANGYQPMTFDANVVAGQVIPYRGTLQQ